MNNMSVIAMAITGENYWQSTKTAAAVLYEEFPLFRGVSNIGFAISWVYVVLAGQLAAIMAYVFHKNQKSSLEDKEA